MSNNRKSAKSAAPKSAVSALTVQIEAAAFEFGKADGVALGAIASLAAHIKGLSGDTLAAARKASDIGYVAGRSADGAATVTSAARAAAAKLFATKVADRTKLQTQLYNGAAKLWSRALGVNQMASLHAQGAKRGTVKSPVPKVNIPAATGAAVNAAAADVAVTPKIIDRAECRKWIADYATRGQAFANTNAANLDVSLNRLLTKHRVELDLELARLAKEDAEFEAKAKAAAAPVKAKRAKR